MDTTLKRLTASLLTLTLLLLVSPLAGAQAADPSAEAENEPSGATPLRLSFTAGDVRFWRPGTAEWVPAQVNIPLAVGDQLATDRLGNVEVQTGPDSFLRIWGDSRFALTSHDENALRISVSNGYLGLDLRSMAPGDRMYVDTPNAALTIAQAGYYRVDVSVERTSVMARRGGRATVTAHGHTVSVAADHQVVAGSAAAPLEQSMAPEADAWDRWSLERTDTLLATESARYVAPQVYGAGDLDRYGTWREEPTYGRLWEPRGVPAGWVPYSTGMWISDPGYGWTWVDTAPWGWAPYHYGRWVFVNGVWAWAPGPRVVRAVYAPALVAFFGAPHPVGRPFVSWVALGWGEPLVPWWGRAGFIGRPWYAGWGGPRHWHRDRFHGRPFDYRNTGVRNAVVGMHRDRFGRERVERARVTTIDVNRLQPVVRNEGGDGRATRLPGADRTVTPPRPIGAPDRNPTVTPPRPIGAPDRNPTVTLPRPIGAPDRNPTVTPPRPIGAPDRDNTVPPRLIGPPEREVPSGRPEAPRERQAPGSRSSGLDTREEPRARAVPPQPDRDPAPVPRVGTPPRGTTTPQQWRRTGDVAPRPSAPQPPERTGSMRREREAPANAQGGLPSQGRR